MPMNPIVPLAGLGFLLMMMGGKKSAPEAETDSIGTGGRGPWLEPVPLPETTDDAELIRIELCKCWSEQNLTGPELLDCLAQRMHPDVPWPPKEGDHPTVLAAWEIFSELVVAWDAATQDERLEACAQHDPGDVILVPDQEPAVDAPTVDFSPAGGVQEPPLDPGEILDVLISDTPEPGRFYRIQSGDTMAQIARQALNSVVPGAGNDANAQARLDYIYCVGSGTGWNVAQYGSTRTTQIYPAIYRINGLTLGVAFLRYHENPIAAVMENRFPERGADAEGQKIQGIGNDYGMIWLPPVDPQVLAELGEPTCGEVTWSDGSSSIDPPPEFFALFGA